MRINLYVMIQIALSIGLIWAVAGIAYELDTIGNHIARLTMVEVTE